MAYGAAANVAITFSLTGLPLTCLAQADHEGQLAVLPAPVDDGGQGRDAFQLQHTSMEFGMGEEAKSKGKGGLSSGSHWSGSNMHSTMSPAEIELYGAIDDTDDPYYEPVLEVTPPPCAWAPVGDNRVLQALSEVLLGQPSV